MRSVPSEKRNEILFGKGVGDGVADLSHRRTVCESISGSSDLESFERNSKFSVDDSFPLSTSKDGSEMLLVIEIVACRVLRVE